MPKYVTVQLTKAQQHELEQLLWHTTLTPRLHVRVQMIRLASIGQAVPQIAQVLRVHEHTVRKYLKAFNVRGFAALADRPRPGRPRALSAADLAALLVQIEAGASGERIWTLRQLQDWLATERGVRISQGRLSVQLRRAKVRWKRLKRSIQHKAKPGLQEQKTADLQTLRSFARQGAVDLYYVDASGFAPTFPLTYTWAPVRVRPLLRYEAPQKRRVNV
jgi:putative transposase